MARTRRNPTPSDPNGESAHSGVRVPHGDGQGHSDRNEPPVGNAPFPPEFLEAQMRMIAGMNEFMQNVAQREMARPATGDRPVLEKLSKLKVVSFKGVSSDTPEAAENWLSNTHRKIEEAQCTFEEKLLGIVSLLEDDAFRWWESIRESV